MSQTYKFRVDRYPLPKEPKEGETLLFGEGLNYKTGKADGVDFYLSDGTRHYLIYNHNHFVRMEYKDDTQEITLLQSTYTVRIQGYRLEPIYIKLSQRNLIYLKTNDENTLPLADNEEPFISKMEMEFRGSA
ncbi:MAG: hypothetical protein RIF33_03520 [Cyclobacteriaceae bacterium]